jgi:fluoride exporter
MKTILFIGIGGFLGSISRYALHKLLTSYFPGFFPLGTLAANLIGCLLIGMIYGIATSQNYLSHEMRMLLAVGFCGSFTTFSTFANENLALLQSNQIMIMIAYTAISLTIGIFMVFVGIKIANSLL